MSEYSLTKNTLTTAKKREGNISEHAPKQKRHQHLERKREGKSFMSMLKHK